MKFLTTLALSLLLSLEAAAGIWLTSPPATVTAGANYSMRFGDWGGSYMLLCLYKGNSQVYAGSPPEIAWTSNESTPQTITWSVYGMKQSGELTLLGSAVTNVVNANTAPTAWVEVEGVSPGAVLTRMPGGAVSITAHFKARDPEGALDIIRPNLWHPDSGYFWNSGGGVGVTGGLAEVVRTLSLDRNGDWYLWSDGHDFPGLWGSSGAWSAGFRIRVRENEAPLQTFESSTASLYNTDTLTGSGWAADTELGAPVTRVEVFVDGELKGNATLGGDRSDVASSYGRSDFRYSGFSFAISIAGLSPGDHTITTRAVDAVGLHSDQSRGFKVLNRAPTGSFTIDGVGANKTITYGQTVRISSSVSDADGNMTVHSYWWDQGNGLYWTHPLREWTYPANMDGWSNLSLGGNGYDASGGSSVRYFDFTPVRAGTYAFHNVMADPDNWIGVGASVLYLTVQKAEQPPISIAGAPTTLSYGGTSGVLGITGGAGTGAVTFTVSAGPGTIVNGNQVQATSGTGTITVTATKAADGNYNSRSTSVNIAAQKINQAALTITNAPSTLTYDNTTAALTTSGGTLGGTPTFSVSGSGTLVGANQVKATAGTGTITVMATKAGDGNYNAVSTSVSIAAQKANQAALTITNAPSTLAYNNTTAALTTNGGTLGGTPTFTVSGSGTLVGANQVKATAGTGTITVMATKAGDGNYNAVSTSVSIAAQKANQAALTITNAPSSLGYNSTSASLGVSGGSTSATPVLTIASGPGLLVNGTQVKATSGTGTIAITATKAGDANFNAATATVGIAATKGANVISFPAIPPQIVRDLAIELGASSSAGLAVSYQIVGGPATVSGSTLSLGTEPGNVTVRASQPGDTNYEAAAPVDRSFRLWGLYEDADGDGMHNDWERSSGLNPYDPSDAAIDSDGDGVSNVDEYNGRRDPQRADNPPEAPTVAIHFTAVAKGTGSLTLNTSLDGKAHLFVFGSASTDWRSPNLDVEVSNEELHFTLQSPIGESSQVTVTSSGLTDYVIRVNPNPDEAANQGLSVECSEMAVEALTKADIQAAGGSFTVRALAGGSLAFGAMDMSRFEKSREVSFGLGTSRAGRSLGRVYFRDMGWFGGKIPSVNVVRGAALDSADVRTSATRFQAKLPAGYVEVRHTYWKKFIEYYPPGQYGGASGALFDFTGTTPIASYVVEFQPISSEGAGTPHPEDPQIVLTGTNRTSITRTIGGVTSILEWEKPGYAGTFLEQASRWDASIGQVYFWIDRSRAIVRVWPWRELNAPRAGLTRIEAKTFRTAMNSRGWEVVGANFSPQPIEVKITRYLGATESAEVGACESSVYATDDHYLRGMPGTEFGAGNDYIKSGRRTPLVYSMDTLAVKHPRILETTPLGGASLTEYYTHTVGGMGQSANNLDGQGAIAYGEPKKVWHTFGDTPGAVQYQPVGVPLTINEANPATTYTYYPDPIDGRVAVKSTVTMKGTTQIGRADFAYATGTFDGRATLTTTATAYSASGKSLTTVSKAYSRRVADLDFRSKPISVVRPNGTKSSYAYLRGTLHADGSWTSADAGSDLMAVEFAGKVGSTISYYRGAPVDPIDLDPTRSTIVERVFNTKGWLVREASYVYVSGTTFALLNETFSDYDVFGQLLGKADKPYVSHATSGRVLYTAAYEGFRKVSETDATGGAISYGYDEYSRLESTTRVGHDATDDDAYDVPALTTTNEYDPLGRVTKTIVSSPGEAEQLVTESRYDTANRITRQIAPGGYITDFSYPAVDHYAVGKTTTVRGKDGTGTITATELSYRDGRKKSVSGSAVADVSYSYVYNASGNLVTTETLTSTGQATTTTADWLGRAISVDTATWAANGAAGPVRTARNIYNDKGELVATELMQGSTLLQPRHLMEYDVFGRLYREGDDINNTFNLADGTGIEPADDANVVQYLSIYEQKNFAWFDGSGPINGGNEWYRYETTLIWPYAADVEPGAADRSGDWKQASVSYTQITGLTDAVASHVVGADANSNWTQSVTSVNRSQKRTTSETFTTGSTQHAKVVTSNGLSIDARNLQGQVSRTAYDGLGRAKAVRDPRLGALDPVNGWTDYVYVPGTGLVQSVTTPDNRSTTFGYDNFGRQNLVVDNAGKTSRSLFDAAGRVTRVWGDTPNPVKYVYNELGQRTDMYTYRTGGVSWNMSACPEAAFDAGGDRTQWTYHGPTGLMEKKTDAAGRETKFAFDTLGRITRRTDARGWVTNYVFYPVNASPATGGFPGALQKVDYAGTSGTGSDPASTPDVTYTYDKRGRVLTVNEGTTLGTRTFNYYQSWSDGSAMQARDSSLALQSEKLSSYFGGHEIAYDYHFGTSGVIRGAAKTLQLGAAGTYQVSYGYDDRMRLTSIGYNAFTPFTYAYEANSNLIDTVTQVTGTGTFDYQRSYDYQADSHRLYSVAHSWKGVANSVVESRLTYNTAGLRETEKTRGVNYMSLLGRTGFGTHADYAYTGRDEVDTAGRYELSSAWERGVLLDGTGRTYDYDAIGNRTADHTGAYTLKTYGSSSTNEYETTPQATNLTYDANGNLLTKGTLTFEYDGENRLVKVINGSSTYTYRYDYLGRRVRRSGTGVTDKRYIYDGWSLIAETNSSGVIGQRFVWGLDVSGSLQGAGGVGGLLMTVDGSNCYFPAYDASHNVIALYNQSGATAAAYEYDPFGNVTKSGGTYANSNPFRYSTKFTDRDTGLIYYGYRYYDPQLGRFINRDPIEEAGGLNLYGFCGNDGVNRWDFLGMEDVFDKIRRTGGTGDADGKTYARDQPLTSTIFGESLDSTPQFVVDYYTEKAKNAAASQGVQEARESEIAPGTTVIVPITVNGITVGSVTFKVPPLPKSASTPTDGAPSKPAANNAVATGGSGPRPGHYDAFRNVWVYPDGRTASFSVQAGQASVLGYESPWDGRVDQSPDDSAYWDARFRADFIAARGGYEPGPILGPSPNSVGELYASFGRGGLGEALRSGNEVAYIVGWGTTAVGFAPGVAAVGIQGSVAAHGLVVNAARIGMVRLIVAAGPAVAGGSATGGALLKSAFNQVRHERVILAVQRAAEEMRKVSLPAITTPK